MNNADMKADRFLRWHNARRRVAHIKAALEAGHTVYICTMTNITKLRAKHIDMVKATRTGAYLQAGKRWDCIDYCGIKIA